MSTVIGLFKTCINWGMSWFSFMMTEKWLI